MSFLSPTLALFAAAAFGAFHLSPERWRRHVLLALCYAFSAWASPLGAIVLLGVTTIAYFLAPAIERRGSEGGKFRLTAVGVAALLLVLVGFKYGGAIAAALRPVLGEGALAGAASVLVPLGLSYYLFKLMGYLLDVYWERVPAEKSFIALALYASFFPQMICGPIQRPADFFSQFEDAGRFDSGRITAGLRRILRGLFKKVVIADPLVPLVAAAHGDPGAHSSLELLLAAYGFAVQLYADFSGITDIAIGLGLMFGVKGPENFNLPFFAGNVQEYWRRWHMSLSSWLLDYVFTPLNLNLRRFGSLGLAIALFVTMVAVGVWHGPRWTYLAFGAIHGGLMVASALTQRARDRYFHRRPRLRAARSVLGPLVTFHLVVLALVVFRADSVGSALDYLRRLVPDAGGVEGMRLDWVALGIAPWTVLCCVVAFALVEVAEVASRMPRWRDAFLAAPVPMRWGVYYAALLSVLMFGSGVTREFLYAQF